MRLLVEQLAGEPTRADEQILLEPDARDPREQRPEPLTDHQKGDPTMAPQRPSAPPSEPSRRIVAGLAVAALARRLVR